MRKLWNKIGWFGFWICLPALHVYLYGTNRPRILVMHKDKVLLVKSWLSDGRWQLPGGGAHKNEDPKAAAIRELFEETGLKIDAKKVRAKGVFTQENDLLHFSYDLFVVRVESESLPAHRTAEIIDAQWAEKKELAIGTVQQHVLDAIRTANKV